MNSPAKTRGSKRGTKNKRAYMHVCPEPTCPRRSEAYPEGEPFAGTAKAIYCSDRCSLRAWRRRTLGVKA